MLDSHEAHRRLFIDPSGLEQSQFRGESLGKTRFPIDQTKGCARYQAIIYEKAHALCFLNNAR